MSITKSRYIELNETHCYTKKFNIALSLHKVLETTLYFSKGFLEAVAEALQLFRMTIVCFLEQKSSLYFFVPQQRHRLLLSYFLYSLLVNLASLEEKSTCRELNCFLGTENNKLDILINNNSYLTFKNENQEPLFLPVLYSGIHGLASSRSDQQLLLRHICFRTR